MSTHPAPTVVPLPDFLQSTEPPSLESIRKSRAATQRGGCPQPPLTGHVFHELEFYLNQTVFDMSGRIDEVQRFLKSEVRAEAAPPEIMKHLAEMLRELKLCADIGNFALGQLTPRN